VTKGETGLSAMVMRSHQLRYRLIAALVLASALFTQLAVAVQPCLGDGDPSVAFSPEQHCHEAPPANLCLAQCLAMDQSPGPTDAGALPCRAAIGIVAAEVGCAHRFDRPGVGATTILAIGPPSYLRLCSLRL